MRNTYSNTIRRAAALGALWLICSLAPARAQMPWLEPEDGDLLHVSTAEGPDPGQFHARALRTGETTAANGTLLLNRAQVQYGLSRWVALGFSIPYLAQQDGLLEKSGLGDTNLSLKLHGRPYEDLPIRVGLRQSISLPTGFEQESDGLLPFTSRQYDYSAQGIFQYDALSGARRLSAYLNPGILLPGGDVDSYATAGFGLSLQKILPFGLGAHGEYYTRWSLVTKEFDAEAFVSVNRELFWGLGVDIGAKRKLLQEEVVDPELHLGLTFDWPRSGGDVLEVRTTRVSRAALLVLPLELKTADPHGCAQVIAEEFRARAHSAGGPLTVFVRTLPGEHLEALGTVRHYELAVRILAIEEGAVEGHSIPLLLRAARGHTRITAQMELISPDGYSVVHREVLTGHASRGLGFDLAPASTSVEAKITPDEVKGALRLSAARDLAEQILRSAVTAMDQRDNP